MGSKCSTLEDLENNEYLKRLCAPVPISPSDSFWNHLFSHAVIVNELTARNQRVQTLFSTLCSNTTVSGNLASFVSAIAARVEQIKSDQLHENVVACWHLTNALAIMRVIVQLSVETLSDERIIQLFNAQAVAPISRLAEAPAASTSGDRRSRTKQRPISAYGDVSSVKIAYEAQILNIAVKLLVDLPLNTLTFFVHLECLQLLLAALSTQIYRSEPVRAEVSIFYRHMMHGPCAVHVSPLLRTLITYFGTRWQSPQRTLLNIIIDYNLLDSAALLSDDSEARKTVRKVQLRKDELRLQPAPADAAVQALTANEAEGSLLYNASAYVASTLMYVVTFGMWNSSSQPQPPAQQSAVQSPVAPTATSAIQFEALTSGSPLASYSVLLLLILSNHCIYSKRAQTLPTQRKPGVTAAAIVRAVPNVNPYREALLLFSNSTDSSADRANFSVDYGLVYRAMAATCAEEHCTLAVYLLLHRNIALRAYVAEQNDIACLLLPLLRVLYEPAQHSSQHINMVLILLLLISESDDFAKNSHEIKLTNVTWFRERVLNEITLGSLLVLVVIRVIQFNLTRSKDRYVQSNCLAALTNLSSSFRDLHPYVPQRVLGLIQQLLKRRDKLTGLLNARSAIAAAEEDEPPLPAQQRTKAPTVKLSIAEIASGKVPPTANEGDSSAGGLQRRGSVTSIATISSVLPPDLQISHEDVIAYENEIEMLEELIRKWLEIINSCLINGLMVNTNLVYSLLYERELMSQLKRRAQFAPAMQNLDLILTYLAKRIDTVQTELCVNELSLDIVYDTIRNSLRVFRRDRLKKVTDYKFKYIEEDSPELFFVPYIWSLIFRLRTDIFVPNQIKLFEVTLPAASASPKPTTSTVNETTSVQPTNANLPQSTTVPSGANEAQQTSMRVVV